MYFTDWLRQNFKQMQEFLAPEGIILNQEENRQLSYFNLNRRYQRLFENCETITAVLSENKRPRLKAPFRALVSNEHWIILGN